MRARLEIMLTGSTIPSAPLLFCPACISKKEMRLVGIEPQEYGRELFTFACDECGRIEARPTLLH